MEIKLKNIIFFGYYPNLHMIAPRIESEKIVLNRLYGAEPMILNSDADPVELLYGSRSGSRIRKSSIQIRIPDPDPRKNFS